MANFIVLTFRVTLFLTAEREENSVNNPRGNKSGTWNKKRTAAWRYLRQLRLVDNRIVAGEGLEELDEILLVLLGQLGVTDRLHLG